ncbi:MAG: hypothetical protein IT337_14970 [Thermomicrobiales bacterium]|nr:hypothetical protein [Thermomicrobiales bacterium]
MLWRVLILVIWATVSIYLRTRGERFVPALVKGLAAGIGIYIAAFVLAAIAGTLN